MYRDEIARLKESRPDINHKEAFATAAANVSSHSLL